MAGDQVTKKAIKQRPVYVIDLHRYYWTPECVPFNANLADNVIALLEIEEALGTFERRGKAWSLSNYHNTFDRDGKLRARHERTGLGLRDMNNEALWTTAGKNKVYLNGGDKTIPNGKYNATSIIEATGFTEWWAKITGPDYTLPPFSYKPANPQERLRGGRDEQVEYAEGLRNLAIAAENATGTMSDHSTRDHSTRDQEMRDNANTWSRNLVPGITGDAEIEGLAEDEGSKRKYSFEGTPRKSKRSKAVTPSKSPDRSSEQGGTMEGLRNRIAELEQEADDHRTQTTQLQAQIEAESDRLFARTDALVTAALGGIKRSAMSILTQVQGYSQEERTRILGATCTMLRKYHDTCAVLLRDPEAIVNLDDPETEEESEEETESHDE